jgi:hypothetical protein
VRCERPKGVRKGSEELQELGRHVQSTQGVWRGWGRSGDEVRLGKAQGGEQRLRSES